MRIISWNVRGLNTPNKRRLIKSQMDLIKCDIFMLQEIKLSKEFADLVFSSWRRWNFLSSPACDASGGLALLWNNYNIEAQLVASATNWMLTLVIRKISKVKFWLFNIYAPSGIQGKSKLWGELKRISSPLRHGSFIIFGGDFNASTDLDEKRGGVFPNKRIMDDFGDFIYDMSLFYCKS